MTHVSARQRSWQEARSGGSGTDSSPPFLGLTPRPAENSVWLTGGHVTCSEPVGNRPGTFLTAPGRVLHVGTKLAAVGPERPVPRAQPRGPKAPVGG